MEKHVRQRSSRFSPAAARCAMRHREASEGMAASISRVVQIGGKMRYILAYHNHIPGRIQILQVKVYTHIPGRGKMMTIARRSRGHLDFRAAALTAATPPGRSLPRASRARSSRAAAGRCSCRPGPTNMPAVGSLLLLLNLVLWIPVESNADRRPAPHGPPAQQPLVPRWKPNWHMPTSTIVQPCNYSGLYDYDAFPALSRYGIVDYDWSNGKKTWINSGPMDCEEMLVEQAARHKARTPDARVFVYRNLVKALPWFTEVRELLQNRSRWDWFISYEGCRTASGKYVCRNNATGEVDVGSNLFHVRATQRAITDRQENFRLFIMQLMQLLLLVVDSNSGSLNCFGCFFGTSRRTRSRLLAGRATATHTPRRRPTVRMEFAMEIRREIRARGATAGMVCHAVNTCLIIAQGQTSPRGWWKNTSAEADSVWAMRI